MNCLISDNAMFLAKSDADASALYTSLVRHHKACRLFGVALFYATFSLIITIEIQSILCYRMVEELRRIGN